MVLQCCSVFKNEERQHERGGFSIKTLAKENHQIQSFLVDECDFHGYYNF